MAMTWSKVIGLCRMEQDHIVHGGCLSNEHFSDRIHCDYPSPLQRYRMAPIFTRSEPLLLSMGLFEEQRVADKSYESRTKPPLQLLSTIDSEACSQ
ncbi:hypothetical protein NPIL_191001 [Nephila pilipes]|uniref:Uncharacterized protein n=1 Tax=Nephila pilipes TaxID=299642 RepID=A0A8X6IHL9_NEPPI|nr:hypothetical protein NPIL_191001 [Nephila pilipes]